MSTTVISQNKTKKIIFIPLVLEQVAFVLSQLSGKDLEVLEELLDKEFQKIIISRGKAIGAQSKKGKTLSLSKLQQVFGK